MSARILDKAKVSGPINKVGAPENRIEWLKPYPDAPARKPQSPVLGSIVTAHAISL
jgi:hypothetical protein